jgi:hypothetical protein
MFFLAFLLLRKEREAGSSIAILQNSVDFRFMYRVKKQHMRKSAGHERVFMALSPVTFMDRTENVF